MASATQQNPTVKGPQPGPQAAPTPATVHPIRPDVEAAPESQAGRKRGRRKVGRPPAPKRVRANKDHPGVVILPPTGRHGWRARFHDPISGRKRRVTLRDVDSIHDPERPDMKPEALRAAWAVDMSQQIQRTISDRQLGRRKIVDVTIHDARAQWLDSEAWAPATLYLYKYATRGFMEYAGAGRFIREIDPSMIDLYRTQARKQRTRPRGRQSVAGTRELRTVNHELRIVATFLRWCRSKASCQLSMDEIKTGLKAYRTKTERLPFLDRPAIRRLLQLARQFEPQAYPSIVCLLLTGMRKGEFAALQWDWIDGDQRIQLPAAVTKTGWRDVDLTVAPEALPPRPARATGPVFPDTSDRQVRQALERLRAMDPQLAGVSAHVLRRTCSTFFTCAFNPWRSAKSHGHSVVIAERHYAGLVRVPAGCTTLAQAMGIQDVLAAPAPRAYRNARPPRKDRGSKRTGKAAA